jgi:hypothetical protein
MSAYHVLLLALAAFLALAGVLFWLGVRHTVVVNDPSRRRRP